MKALTVTASILLAVLLLGIGWLAFFPGDAGNPVVTVAVAPPPPKPPAPPPSAQPAAPGSSIDLPPGFGIAPVKPAVSPRRSSQPLSSNRRRTSHKLDRRPRVSRRRSKPLPFRRLPARRRLCRRHLSGNSFDHARAGPRTPSWSRTLNMGRFPRSLPTEGGPLTFMRARQNTRRRPRPAKSRASRC